VRLGDFATGAVIAFIVADGALGLWIVLGRLDPAPSETCWKDPHPERSLDFDFYTGIDGRPQRCGYLQTGVLPTVIGDRGLDLILQCYSLARVECHK
jgi:hypothetical protein